MSIVERQILSIPPDKIKGVEQMVGKILHIDLENLPKKFQKPFETTRDIAYQNFSMSSVFESYPISEVKADTIYLKNGSAVKSAVIAELFPKAKELVVTITTLHGFEEADSKETNMFVKMLLDSWGTAFIECANKYVDDQIDKMIQKSGLFTAHSFSPGQNDTPIELQTIIFELLKPSEINVSINKSFMMMPMKSVSGFIPVLEEENVEKIRPCDLCERKETCPNAYA